MNSDDVKTLYMNNLNAVKTALKKSAAQMAQEMDVSVNTLASYLKGERTTSLETAGRLYKTYNVNLGWFVTGRGNMFNADETYLKNFKTELCAEMLHLLRSEGLIK